jgi:N-acylglucosamine 2-epimerase
MGRQTRDSGIPTTRQGLMDLAAFYHQQLFDDCLPFWFPRAVDETHGGFVHCFDGDGTLVDDDKSVWAQGRMSWMLLTLFSNTNAVRNGWRGRRAD